MEKIITLKFTETKSKVVLTKGKNETYYIQEVFYYSSDFCQSIGKSRKTRVPKSFYNDVLNRGKKALLLT